MEARMRSSDYLRAFSMALTPLMTSVASAEDLPASIHTPAGVVEIKPAAGPPCGMDSYDFNALIGPAR